MPRPTVDTADFVRSHAAELAKLAKSIDLSIAATLLEMVVLEVNARLEERSTQDDREIREAKAHEGKKAGALIAA